MLGLHCFLCHYSLTPSDTLDAIFHLNLNHTFSALYILLTLWYFFLLMFLFYLQQDMRNLMYSFILLHWVENVAHGVLPDSLYRSLLTGAVSI